MKTTVEISDALLDAARQGDGGGGGALNAPSPVIE
jgi:hypothetical protein